MPAIVGAELHGRRVTAVQPPELILEEVYRNGLEGVLDVEV
jgi:hypothetical protein